jgi:Polyketide cyclase / dehydrase and lipid transport
MAKIFRSSVINAPIDEVWARIRDFNALPDWHPAFTDSHIENDEPGDKERLLSLSDVRRLCTLPGDAGSLVSLQTYPLNSYSCHTSETDRRTCRLFRNESASSKKCLLSLSTKVVSSRYHLPEIEGRLLKQTELQIDHCNRFSSSNQFNIRHFFDIMDNGGKSVFCFRYGKLLLHYCQHTAMRPGIRGSKHFLADLPRICTDILKSRPHKFHQQRIVMIVGCF